MDIMTYTDYLRTLYRNDDYLILGVNNNYISVFLKESCLVPLYEEVHVGPVKGEELNKAFDLKGIHSFNDDQEYYYLHLDEFKPSSIPEFENDEKYLYGVVHFREEIDERYKHCNGTLVENAEWRKKTIGEL